jgi:DNA-binding GntR family transcriptional regulator
LLGYEYISPSGVSSMATGGAHLDLVSAKVLQRQNGGGTIVTKRRTVG